MDRIRREIKIVVLLLMAGIVGVMQTGCERTEESKTEIVLDVPTANKQEFENDIVAEKREVEIVPTSLAVRRQESDTNTLAAVGSLEITLPPGWKIEERVSDEGVAQYVLVDAHSEYEGGEIEAHNDGYEHEIRITSYEIRQMPELTLELAAAMRAYFSVPLLYGIKGSGKTQEIKGGWMYGENEEEKSTEYFLFSENEAGDTELFYVREGNFNITDHANDVEAFWQFMDDGLVRTDSGRHAVERSGDKETECYFLFNQGTEKEIFMVLQRTTDEIQTYQGGDYQTPVSTTKSDIWNCQLKIMDIDQDGYEDFLCDRRLFDPACVYKDFAEEVFDGYLWKEDESRFVYVDGAQMLEQYGSIWEERIQLEELRQNGGQIPDGLVAYLSEYLLKDREEMREAMAALVSDRELTNDEVKALAGKNLMIKNELLAIRSAYGGSGIWLEVDADNDGIEDIFLCEYLGGSLGSVYYYFFKGTAKGEYELTGSEAELKKEFGFFGWDGKKYLAKTTWEFTKKCVNGISLETYEDGKNLGGVWLAITEKKGENARSIQTSYLANGKYWGLADALEVFSGQYQSGSYTPVGTAEEETEGDYGMCSDLDNDGEKEAYDLEHWQTTNYYTLDTIIFTAEETKVQEHVDNRIREDLSLGNPVNLWVDKTEYGNVVYVIYEEGLYDFHVCGYLFSEGDSQKLVQVDCSVQTEVTVEKLN